MNGKQIYDYLTYRVNFIRKRNKNLIIVLQN